MKKISVLLVLVLLTFAMVIPAATGGNGLAGGRNGSAAGTGTGSGQGQPGTRSVLAFAGTISAIGTNTITVEVVAGNNLAQSAKGTQVSVTVTANTRYLLRDGTTVTIISFADLEVDQAVSINGYLLNNVWTASRVTQGASLSCLP